MAVRIDKVKLLLASPERIREWSYGEVTKAETINYKDGRPEPGGLFCERIFGPTRDYECACRKYQRQRGEGRVCERCGVEITSARVRRKRMGHIELAAPVAHAWFARGSSSPISVLLNMSHTDLEALLSYGSFIFLRLQKKRLLDPSIGVFRPKDPEQGYIPPHIEELEKLRESELTREVEETITLKVMDWLDQYEGPLADALRTEILSIAKRSDERVHERQDWPLNILHAAVGKRELREPLIDPETGEILVEKGTLLDYNTLLHAVQGGADLRDALVFQRSDKKPVRIYELVRREAQDDELAEDLKHPGTGRVVARAGEPIPEVLWNILKVFKNSQPIRIVNRASREVFIRARSKRIKEIWEIVEGMKTLLTKSAYNPYDLQPPTGREPAYLIDGIQYRNVYKLRSIILRRLAPDYRPEHFFEVSSGAEALLQILKELDLPRLQQLLQEAIQKLKDDPSSAAAALRKRYQNRLQLVSKLLRSGNRPEWMILTRLPVIPPDLRPLVQLEGGRHASSDLNELYRTVIQRNNRLKRLLETNAPELVLRNEKRILQEAVDAVLDNKRRPRPIEDSNGRTLKSLTESLRGKKGRFRQNLLGKRVDYSGRAVIVVGPHLRLWQCGLPRSIALELFAPFVMHELVKRGFVEHPKLAKQKLERIASLPPHEADQIWDALEKVVRGKVVLLNRAPTLHRLSIQAFEPVLVEGNAIMLHPLVCAAYNADFDGDQMAVHLPLSIKAQTEARLLMLSPRCILLPADGSVIAVPSQDMVLGLHYMTLDLHRPHEADIRQKRPQQQEKKTDLRRLKTFPDLYSVARAYHAGFVDLHDHILLRVPQEWTRRFPQHWRKEDFVTPLNERDPRKPYVLVRTTVGRAMFNIHMPEELRFYNSTLTKKSIKQLCARVFRELGPQRTVEFLDDLKDTGFRVATHSGLSLAITDVVIPEKKEKIIAEAEARMLELEKQGIRPDDPETKERWREQVIEIWNDAIRKISDEVQNLEDPTNPLLMMVRSGSRGNEDQLRQLTGMRGLMADPAGRIIPMPIKSNFREGLTVQEYFISTHGARKGLTDTALRTSKAGYLTRRLVDVAHWIFITEKDCGSSKGIVVGPLYDLRNVDVREAVGKETGRGIFHPKTGELLVAKGTRLSAQDIQRLREAGIQQVPVVVEVESLEHRIIGRIAKDSVPDPETGELIVEAQAEIDEDAVARIATAGIRRVHVRSPLTCSSKYGVCQLCYGRNFATGQLVEIGEAVGIIAAQAIGEPGTQLTLRTFHTGGIAGGDTTDITQGLPQAEMYFEAYATRFKPTSKGAVLFTRRVGEVEEIVPPDPQARGKDAMGYIRIRLPNGESVVYEVPPGREILVHKGQTVRMAEPLTDGFPNPREVLHLLGPHETAQYIVDNIQRVYHSQGVTTADKHVEIIVRNMIRFVEVTDPGDSEYQYGQEVLQTEFAETNARLRREGKRTARGRYTLLGIKNAALYSPSFLSGASFQETPKVLRDAALAGAEDYLRGLKENLILGRPIPCGTGFPVFRDVEYRIPEFATATITSGTESTPSPEPTGETSPPEADTETQEAG